MDSTRPTTSGATLTACWWSTPPKMAVSGLVNSLKGVSARMLRRRYPVGIHGGDLWSPSYFAVERAPA